MGISRSLRFALCAGHFAEGNDFEVIRLALTYAVNSQISSLLEFGQVLTYGSARATKFIGQGLLASITRPASAMLAPGEPDDDPVEHPSPETKSGILQHATGHHGKLAELLRDIDVATGLRGHASPLSAA